MRELLQRESVDEFWLNFSDPWPKPSHAHRRLFQTDFIRQLAACLRPGGWLHAATDDVPYAEQVDDVLSGEPLLENAFPTPWREEAEGRVPTLYEMEWRAKGRPLHFFSYRRSGV